MSRNANLKKTGSTASNIIPNKAPPSFTKTLYANVMKDDLNLFTPQERENLSASIWSLAQKRKNKSALVRLYNPTTQTHGWSLDHTVLEIINDDMPFLVASVTGALQNRGLSIHFIAHPVINVTRDSNGQLLSTSTETTNGTKTKTESFMHIQFDHTADQETLKSLQQEIEQVLADVRASVEDWAEMRQRMRESVEYTNGATGVSARDAKEATEFLQWLETNNFTFLGYRDIDLEQKNGQLISVKVKAQGGLGVLRDPSTKVFGGMRALQSQHTTHLQKYVREHDQLVVTKTNLLSRVHRMVPMDAIFIRRFNDAGQVIGERLFVGLFTSQSYSQNSTEIPLLRGKIGYVLHKSSVNEESHNGKALTHILNNYPHDELFQISKEELLDNCLGILQLQERARVALFVRHDPFERFVTCLIYVPRDRYDSSLRSKIKKHLEESFAGHAHDWNVRIDDSLLARLFVTIHTPRNAPQPDITKLEDELRELCRSWTDRLREHLTNSFGEARAMRWLNTYADAFNAAYRDDISPEMAIYDIASLDKCTSLPEGGLVTDIRQDSTGLLHLKLFHVGKPIVLSNVLPKIEDMGLNIEYMGGPYEVVSKGSNKQVFIHEFVGTPSLAMKAEFSAIKPAFENTFSQVFSGTVESDAFNSLSLSVGLDPRSIVILRLFARYLRQLRLPYSHDMMAATFVAHPEIATKVVQLFIVRHDPQLKGKRDQAQKAITESILQSLSSITAIEDDRIIRRYLNLIECSLRTNYFQLDSKGEPKPYISIKFDSRAIDFMPLPKPLYEIFVFSPRTEAIHLRGGKVARGGIRWSDRREDFRSEILGLIKAQMVKNTVIVPVGSKGGFIVKQPPADADKFMAEGIECYRILMRGMLDITDNRKGSKIIPPTQVVRHDGDDPYLVVAADKGTAKFSDIANAMSQEYGFWLDDAFASGGSVGYDHKGMGITARGAWEAIKRHFRETGKDIQTTDFTCIGVGDMSGDVFGNGMLLSKHTRLLAAFDHRHIFCDPQADAAIGFAERQRLFNLPRSSWDDYDRSKIGKGGGVFPRNVKSIAITPEMKKAYGITADSLAPTDLMQALLKAEVELMYFGGIGTYVKAASETHDEASDRANDALRINGAEIRALVVGEGANLGVTQRGRIEYALKGGRINTDAIDNSAGVDTSDHEVNIKILCRQLIENKSLTLESRNKLLRSMTDNVAKLVLADNYAQPLALSIAEADAANNLPSDTRAMSALEKVGLLHRAVEYLPNADQLSERARLNKGLTRPEIAVVMAYAKLWLYDEILASDLPSADALAAALHEYFPDALQKKYADAINNHQLRREIVATQITNDFINRAGYHVLFDQMEQTGRSAVDVVRTYLLVRQSLGINNLWESIEKLDNVISAQTQINLFGNVRNVVCKAIAALMEGDVLPKNISGVITQYKAAIGQLPVSIDAHKKPIGNTAKKPVNDVSNTIIPTELANRITSLPKLATSLGLIDTAKATKVPLESLTSVYFEIGELLGFDWLQREGRALPATTSWRREALAHSLADLGSIQKSLAVLIATKSAPTSKKQVGNNGKVASWLSNNQKAIEHYTQTLGEWQTYGRLDQAMLDMACRLLGNFL